MKKTSFVIIILTIGFLCFFLSDDELFEVKKVNISVNSGLEGNKDYFMVQSSLGEKLVNIKGRNLWSIGLKKATEVAVEDPRIEKIELSRKIPNTIIAKVTAETPLFYFSSKGSLNYVVTMNAKIIDIKKNKNAYIDLPILKGEIFRKNIEKRQFIIEWFNELPAEGLISKDKVSQIEYIKNKGFKIHLNQRPEGILLGEKELNRKTLRAERVLRYLVTKEVNARLVDARYREKVVVKLQEAP